MPRPLLRLFDGTPHTRPDLEDEVRELQTLLKSRGHPLKPDGLFGRETEAALKRFQAEHGLDDDGIAGPLTWAALLGEPAPDPDHTLSTTYPRNHRELGRHLEAAEGHRAAIRAAARAVGVAPAVVAGIGSRESGWGLLLKPAGPAGCGDATRRAHPKGDRPGGLPPDGLGFGRGLMQIDWDAHPFARGEDWKDPDQNIAYGCRVFENGRALLARKLGLEGPALLRAALAAYNCGPGNVLRALRDGRDCDFYTAHRDYGRDVLDRAGFFRLHGWE